MVEAKINKAVKWQDELKSIRATWYEQNYQAAKDFGAPIPKPYTDKNTNGLTRAVIDYLKFSGCYANRVNTTGSARIEKVEFFGGQVKENLHWVKGNMNKGTADITAIIKGRHVAIEIKCAATKDKIRPDQLKEQKRIEAAGGIYIVVKTMPDFIEWYKSFTNE